MKNNKRLVIVALALIIAVSAMLLTACNSEEKVYESIFSLCFKQKNLQITVKQGDITV